LLLLRLGGDGSPLRLAVGRARLDDALPLASVLALALVVGARAGALPLAGVDPRAPDLVRAGLLFRPCMHRTRQEQGRGRAGDENALAVHQSPPSARVVRVRRCAPGKVSPAGPSPASAASAKTTLRVRNGISSPACCAAY